MPVTVNIKPSYLDPVIPAWCESSSSQQIIRATKEALQNGEPSNVKELRARVKEKVEN